MKHVPPTILRTRSTAKGQTLESWQHDLPIGAGRTFGWISCTRCETRLQTSCPVGSSALIWCPGCGEAIPIVAEAGLIYPVDPMDGPEAAVLAAIVFKAGASSLRRRLSIHATPNPKRNQ